MQRSMPITYDLRITFIELVLLLEFISNNLNLVDWVGWWKEEEE